MRGVAGYSFKHDILTEKQLKVLNDAMASSNDLLGTGFEWDSKEKQQTYLVAPYPDSFVIMGVGDRGAAYTDGTIWGSDQYAIASTIVALGFPHSFPYNIAQYTIYMIKNGETFLSQLHKGQRVRTPQGDGKIWCVDEAVCVELDTDSSILYEFDIDELELIKNANNVLL